MDANNPTILEFLQELNIIQNPETPDVPAQYTTKELRAILTEGKSVDANGKVAWVKNDGQMAKLQFGYQDLDVYLSKTVVELSLPNLVYLVAKFPIPLARLELITTKLKTKNFFDSTIGLFNFDKQWPAKQALGHKKANTDATIWSDYENSYGRARVEKAFKSILQDYGQGSTGRTRTYLNDQTFDPIKVAFINFITGGNLDHSKFSTQTFFRHDPYEKLQDMVSSNKITVDLKSPDIISELPKAPEKKPIETPIVVGSPVNLAPVKENEDPKPVETQAYVAVIEEKPVGAPAVAVENPADEKAKISKPFIDKSLKDLLIEYGYLSEQDSTSLSSIAVILSDAQTANPYEKINTSWGEIEILEYLGKNVGELKIQDAIHVLAKFKVPTSVFGSDIGEKIASIQGLGIQKELDFWPNSVAFRAQGVGQTSGGDGRTWESIYRINEEKLQNPIVKAAFEANYLEDLQNKKVFNSTDAAVFTFLANDDLNHGHLGGQYIFRHDPPEKIRALLAEFNTPMVVDLDKLNKTHQEPVAVKPAEPTKKAAQPQNKAKIKLGDKPMANEDGKRNSGRQPSTDPLDFPTMKDLSSEHDNRGLKLAMVYAYLGYKDDRESLKSFYIDLAKEKAIQDYYTKSITTDNFNRLFKSKSSAVTKEILEHLAQKHKANLPENFMAISAQDFATFSMKNPLSTSNQDLLNKITDGSNSDHVKNNAGQAVPTPQANGQAAGENKPSLFAQIINYIKPSQNDSILKDKELPKDTHITEILIPDADQPDLGQPIKSFFEKLNIFSLTRMLKNLVLGQYELRVSLDPDQDAKRENFPEGPKPEEDFLSIPIENNAIVDVLHKLEQTTPNQYDQAAYGQLAKYYEKNKASNHS